MVRQSAASQSTGCKAVTAFTVEALNRKLRLTPSDSLAERFKAHPWVRQACAVLCQLPTLQPVRRLLNRLIAAAMLMITVRDKAHDTAPDTFALDKTSNNEKFYATLSINGIYIPARCDSALKAQVNVVGDQRQLGSIALQKEANATLVRNKQGSTLLPNVFIKGKSNKQCCSFQKFSPASIFMSQWRQMR